MPTPLPTPDSHQRTRSLLLAALPVLAAVLWLGNDASWDLRNYHLYGPHAWLHGRQAIDIAAAQMQGYQDPLLDLPMYALAMAGAPAKLIGVWLALPVVLALCCLLRLQRRLAVSPPRWGEQLFLVLLALSGAATWSTLGLAMDDAFVAAGMLGALTLLLDVEGGAPSLSRCLAAGGLAGATAGLKLSAAFYCPALALALPFLPGPGSVRAKRLLLLALGGCAGFALTYGWWGWMLWQAHGNPFFPYFNQWFRSPDVAAISWVDLRFRPPGLLDVLLAPFRLLFRSHLYSEAGMKDPRLLLALFGCAWLAWSNRRASDTAWRALVVFVFAGVLGWALQSGIYRYAIALELLGALALAVLLARLPRGRAAAMLLALLLVSVDTRRPNWQRVDATQAPVPVLATPLPADALVVTASADPLGYLALVLPDQVPMLGLDNNLVHAGDCGALARRAAARLAAQRGPIFLASNGDDREPGFLREQHGLARQGTCLNVHASIGDARLCPLVRVTQEKPACF